MAKTSAQIKVEGLDELLKSLRYIKDDGLNKMLKSANQDIADEVIRRALPKVPVGKTGRLKASVRGSGSLSGAIGRAGKASVPYAPAIHWGRKKGGVIEGRPFLRDAARDSTARAKQEFVRSIDRLLDKIR